MVGAGMNSCNQVPFISHKFITLRLILSSAKTIRASELWAITALHGAVKTPVYFRMDISPLFNS